MKPTTGRRDAQSGAASNSGNRADIYCENTTSGIRKITIRIFMYEGLPREIHANEERSEFHRGGYGIPAPAMLVYRENTTPITIKYCNVYFHARGLRPGEVATRRLRRPWWFIWKP